ncbi:MAG: hypothetical protein HUJ26_18615 [Planctomycetaceae bacterium]|nr:hypothetical protein [Planctomycetaceae bacterium]
MVVNRLISHPHHEIGPAKNRERESSPPAGMDALLKSISSASNEDQEERFLFLVGDENSTDVLGPLEEIPTESFDQIVFIDCGCPESVRNQAEIAGLQIITVSGVYQPGYVRKMCFDLAQRESAKMLVLFELKHRRDLSALSAIIKLIDQEIWDVILGSRFDDFLPMSKRGQSKPHQLGPRRGKQLIADIFYGQRLVDPDTDFIACRVHPLWVLPYQNNRDSRIFAWQFIAQTLGSGFRIGELPLRVARSENHRETKSRITLSDRWACLQTLMQSWLKRFRIWRKPSPKEQISSPDCPPPAYE